MQKDSVVSDQAFLRQDLIDLFGGEMVSSLEENLMTYETDWRGQHLGKAFVVVKPKQVVDIQKLMVWVNHQKHLGVCVIPVGGQTGLCGGALPPIREDGVIYPIMLDLTHLDHIDAIDELHGSVYVQAGVILQKLQEHVRSSGWLYPVSLASEGSCTIGGNIATNAGGVSVLQYGMTREQCLALDVVLANGKRVWLGKGLYKDNSGFDLKQIIVGSEGTLAMVVGAVVRLVPQPAFFQTALVSLDSEDQLLAFFRSLRQKSGALLTSFELMSQRCLQLVQQNFSVDRHLQAIDQTGRWFVLCELSIPAVVAQLSQAESLLVDVLSQLSEEVVFNQVWIAKNEQERQIFWSIRERIPLAQKQTGPNIKHDVALPISGIFPFLKKVRLSLSHSFPSFDEIVFGHMGDGNLHYNVAGVDMKEASLVQALVYQCAVDCGGSLSAEHGIGAFRREQLQKLTDPVVLDLMKKVKQVFDPHEILNPQKVLP
jgi:FAD/FMN-containing dehydrogenase